MSKCAGSCSNSCHYWEEEKLFVKAVKLCKLFREEGRHGQGAELTAGARRIPKPRGMLLILAFLALLGSV